MTQVAIQTNKHSNKPATALVGWRGMVGSVLLERMIAEDDFSHIDAFFFSTSQAGQPLTNKLRPLAPKQTQLLDAFQLESLAACQIIITCQGGDYTSEIYPKLRTAGWQGYFIDAASTLRQEEDAIICLEPVNSAYLLRGLKDGIKTFVGGNCTTSTMVMGLYGLFKENLVRWISMMSYQAISGAGARAMDELLLQMQNITQKNSQLSDYSFLERQLKLGQHINSPHFPSEAIGAALANNLLPWIDSDLQNGQSREEKKTMQEANKILARSSNPADNNHPIAIDGICVRVPTLRCHSKAFTIQLKKEISANAIEELLSSSNPFVKVIPNNKQDTLKMLTPAAVNGSLNIHIGRIRKTNISPTIITAFAVGDQLLWGAAEPLRCMLRMIAKNKFSTAEVSLQYK